jgi:two-component system, OmpR family, phosphate regulon response regulator PhoB
MRQCHARPPRVLIVDDDTVFRGCAFKFLQQVAGFECLAVASGKEALLACSRRSPDAVVLDLALGDINGFDVFRALSLDPRTKSIPVVLVTGRGGTDLLESAAKCSGAAAFLRKPLDLAALGKELRRALGRLHSSEQDQNLDVVERGRLRIDMLRRRVFVGGLPLRLGPRRVDLLCALAASKDGLPETVLRGLGWGGDSLAANIVRQTINRLRTDLARACGKDMIVSIPGGYKLL